jgi:hypothetical protein
MLIKSLPHSRLLLLFKYFIMSPPLWSSGQSSWLQIQRSGFDSWCYQIFWEVVGLEQGPPRLVNTIEELLGRTSSGFGLENREYGRRDPLHWPCFTLYPQIIGTDFANKWQLLGRIARSQTEDTEFSFYFIMSHRSLIKSVNFAHRCN